MILAIVVFLAHALLFGFATQRAGERSGMDNSFWWGFWLGALGLLIVALREPPKAYTGENIFRPKWRCFKCGTYHSAERRTCQTCGAAYDAPNPVKSCISCGAANKAANQCCFACGKKFEN